MTLQLQRYSGVSAFYERAMPFLAAHEAENNLMLGLLNGLKVGEFAEQPPYMACVERDGALISAALRTPPHNLLLSRVAEGGALDLIAEDVHHEYGALPGVQSVADAARQFAQIWATRTGASYSQGMAQQIYQLERVRPIGDVSHKLRRVVEADRELVLEWMNAFQEEAFRRRDEQAVAASVQRFFSAAPDTRGLFFWVAEGQPVSIVGYSGPTPNGMRVGPVYTPPELRRRGYASACTAAVSQHILDSGRKYCFLFTDLSNPTSNRIYQQIGYEPVCQVELYRFDSA